MNSSKEELLKNLEEYKGILNKEMVDYLNSIIELDFSVIKEYISDNDRKVLSQLDIYRKASQYNIYNRAINLINNNGVGAIVSKFPIINPKTIDISISGKYKNIKIFTFDNNINIKNQVLDEFNTKKIGDITLYQTLEGEKIRQEEINRLYNKIDYLKNIISSYSVGEDINLESPNTFWLSHIKEEILKYKLMIEQLQNKKEICDIEKKEIDIRKKYYELFIEDYGLNNDSFSEEDNIFMNLEDNNSKLNKTLYKRIPSITIKNNIKYI